MISPEHAKEPCTGLTVICPKCGNRFKDKLADDCYDEDECHTEYSHFRNPVVGPWGIIMDFTAPCEFGQIVWEECEAFSRSGRRQYNRSVMICKCGHSWAAGCATFVGEEVPA